MANVNHSTLTDPYLHEPKGVAAASNGSVYFADGAGSGDWEHLTHYVGGYVVFNSATPTSQAISTTFSALDPTFSLAENSGFTALSSPNARLRYDEPEAMVFDINFASSLRHTGSVDHDIELALYKNGTAVAGAHVIQTSSSSAWQNMSLTGQVELNATDYIEIFTKADASITLELASAYLTIKGVYKS